ncbi:MAG: hypothetical protein FWF56_06040 [Firmicutes bacterium]|nr:hypothetical protein [Bacillota bacterium]MCL1953457.1 hypothetical protein [Bacillota bacterium]
MEAISNRIGQQGYAQKQYAKAVKKENKDNSKVTPRQVTVTYGHNGSGQAYTYLANENVKAGQTVTPMVTHPTSGKTYKTLGVVQSTRDSTNSASQGVINNLSNQGILLKKLGRTDQKSLPNYYTGWGKDSKAQYDLLKEARLDGKSDSEIADIKRITSQIRRETRDAYRDGNQAKMQAKMRKLNNFGEPV